MPKNDPKNRKNPKNLFHCSQILGGARAPLQGAPRKIHRSKKNLQNSSFFSNWNLFLARFFYIAKIWPPTRPAGRKGNGGREDEDKDEDEDEGEDEDGDEDEDEDEDKDEDQDADEHEDEDEDEHEDEHGDADQDKDKEEEGGKGNRGRKGAREGGRERKEGKEEGVSVKFL